jgi:hypothetical protein
MRGLHLLRKLFEGGRLRGGFQDGRIFTEAIAAQQDLN